MATRKTASKKTAPKKTKKAAARKPKRPGRKPGSLSRKNYSSLMAWESAVARAYGGCYDQWPAWAKEVLRKERGYV